MPGPSPSPAATPPGGPRLTLVLARVAGALALAAGTALAQAPQAATITGRVTDAATGQPIVAAQLSVVGTTLGTQTNAAGQYTIRGVGAGPAEVRVLRVGFAEQKSAVTVTAGQAATLDFQMRSVATTLTPVVTTATGEQRRVEVGNAIAQVNAAEVVATRPVANVGDLLTARAAGVQVLPGTQTGAGTRVRIRGTSSLSLTNNPIYVIDGVRMESSTGSSTLSVGGTTPSRVGDLNPEEIASLEIVKGPSAATLYGTDAANGVIVITTKRGAAGRPQWTYYTEQTGIRDNNQYPTAYRGWRSGTTAATTSTASNTVQCFLTQRIAATGACAQDSVTAYNLHDDPEATPYGTGYRQQHGLQLGGGSETVRYFLHGEWEDEDGVTQVPQFERRYLASRGLSLLSSQESPNRLTRATTRANFNLSLPSNADIAVSAGYTSQDLRLPMSDDSGVSGIAANVYGGPGFKYNLSPAGDTLYGWRQFTPRDIYQAQSNQAVERLIGSTAANWRPQDWLALRGNLGLDFTDRRDTQLCRFANCPDVGEDRLGYKRDNRATFFIYTVDLAGTATRQLSQAVTSKTTAGFQFYRNVFSGNRAVATRLPPGATTVTAGSVPSVEETTTESRTLGGYVEQNVAFNDRLFLTAAVRSDRNSAFGADFKTVFYPKFSASWVLSQEPFFPQASWMNQLRLRGAYGASGVQPGTIDAVQYFSSTTARVRPTGTAGEAEVEAPGVVYSTLGNRNLKPERSAELELGVDGTFWNSRLTAELTYYNKRSTDALFSRVLPPSAGTGATSRLENLGAVRNWGWESLINAQLLQRRAFGWDVTFNGSMNSNELESLGGLPNIVTSSTLQQREGYPLNGVWTRALTGYNDANGDGIIALSEITVSDTAVFLGYTQPRRELALTNGFDFWNRRFRVSAMLDYKGGHKLYNNTERIRCASRLNCAGLIDPNASFFEQARSVAVREHASRTVGGYIEDADFIRFRELALNFNAPETFARRLRSRTITATLAARNLGTLWTKYSGVDPEATGTATGDSPSEFQAFAPVTFYTFRISLGL
ncbi:SusC/RagA family TonB-linked outer membrane protein [Roseisolibacter sp. H3M3-2]|uniref:SusC/RagA family TonB-linked outer membrane protein n=1 Tax=Roseisolibacter sp. H3M3-2 TaxID=3031323 RepID=UPI0023DA1100|nr:SusC/RagA family TonB-linked outer membrane protein [Roseisolibacter sp. H3M3-2]MDF1504310.1 SusC/RagA family TonB-linked outer membrane protein [Roseisolibacter sp. H3M3-2]